MHDNEVIKLREAMFSQSLKGFNWICGIAAIAVRHSLEQKGYRPLELNNFSPQVEKENQYSVEDDVTVGVHH